MQPQMDELVKALEYYANAIEGGRAPNDQLIKSGWRNAFDGGEIARQALAVIEDKNTGEEDI